MQASGDLQYFMYLHAIISHASHFLGCRTLESCDVRLSQMNEDDEVAISEVFKQRTLKNARRH